MMDREYMTRCLELAAQAKAAGESAVGSIVVTDSGVLAEGVEATNSQLDPSAHAELLAIRSACAARGSMDLSDCTLYTTVEPCFSCAFVIRSTGIRRVVIGTDAGEIGAAYSKYPLLTDATFTRWGAPPTVTHGVLEEEARAAWKG